MPCRRFLSGLLPNSTPEDVRLLLTYLHLLDVNGNGRIEFKELLVALRVRAMGWVECIAVGKHLVCG